jgi:hypothetical protein
MKVILILVLGFTSTLTCTSDSSKAKGRHEKATLMQSASGLSVSLIAQKHRYKRNGQLKLDVLLTNVGKDAIYLFGQLDWGLSASFVLRVRDASGKEVQPVGRFDDLTLVSPSDTSAFVKLFPYHFLGTNFFSPLDVLNLNKPGKYAVFVEYHSPFAATDVPLSPFWGKENGTIRSNVVHVEVVP